MKSPHYFRMFWLILISLIIIACGLFNPSDEVANLQSTIDALTSQQVTSQDYGEPPPPITTDGQIQATPEIEPTESSWKNALTYIDQYGGSTTAVAVKENYAYIGQGPRMVVLDISDPASPVFVNESELLPGLVMGLEINEDYAFVTTRFSGLHIFDISQATNPKRISQVQPGIPGCGPLILDKGIAYIACNASGLFIVDVNNPAAPKVLASDVIRGAVFSIAINNNHVYMSERNGIHVIDVSDPTLPQEVGFFDSETIPTIGSCEIQSVEMCQGDLCTAVGNHGFVILDLTNPIQPVIKASISPYWPVGIISDGQYAFLVDELNGVRIYGISDPTQPQQVGLMPTSVGGFEFTVQDTNTRGMAIAGDILYVPDQAYGLVTIDISDPSQPVRVGGYMTPVPDVMMGINVVGNFAYTINRAAGFRVIDISNPENLLEIFYDDEPKCGDGFPNPFAIEVIGDYAYISGACPLQIYDITNPNQPEEMGIVDSFPDWDDASDLSIFGNIAYLSARGGNKAIYPGSGLWVIDISDPTMPTPINFLDLPNEHWSLWIHDSVLYALDGNIDQREQEPLSLRVIDISNPTQPAQIKSIPMPEFFALGILVTEDWLYLGSTQSKLKLCNISDPLNPIETPLSFGSWPTRFASKFAVSDSTLILNGNMAYDISDPTTLDLVGIAYEAQDAWTATIVDDLVFIVTSFTGIYVYQLEG